MDLSEALLTAYERGRLQDIMDAIASEDEITEEQLLQILIEANVLQALNLAEVIRTKIATVEGLESIVESRELEANLRDYIAQHPWLISAEWETFRIETGITTLVREAAGEAGLNTNEDWQGRVDLVLASGEQLLVLEFMRPGRTIDWDHVNRFERYVRILRTKLAGVTGVRFIRIAGYVVADNIDRRPEVVDKLQQLERENLFALDWATLLDRAKADLNEFMEILSTRQADDPRLQELTRRLRLTAAMEYAESARKWRQSEASRIQPRGSDTAIVREVLILLVPSVTLGRPVQSPQKIQLLNSSTHLESHIELACSLASGRVAETQVGRG